MRGRGQANSDSTTYNNTNVTAGGTLSISSGKDTNLIGAVVSGNTTNVNVGGNLTIQSLQDVATSSASQSTTGVSVSIPIYGTGGSASISQTRQNSNSNYQSVNQQSGISAGDGGFNITVGGNTNLVGATISSTVNASAAGNNSLTTATLTTSDIQNQATASASSSGTSIGTSMMSGSYGLAKGVVGNLMNRGSASSNDSSTTTSAISGATVTVGNTTTNTANGGVLKSTNGITVSSNTTSTNRVLAKPDVAGLQTAAQQQQADSMLLFNTVTAFTDEAFKKSFLTQAKMYKKVTTTGEDGKPVVSWSEMSDAEKAAIPKGSKVASNGIFTGEADSPQAAQNLAAQNNNSDFLVHFPQANNAISELLISGYQKFLEGGTLGLTSATQQNVNLWQQTGGDITLDGHSRGGMTVGNALQYLNSTGATGSNTQVNLFGSAQNAQDTANTLNSLTNGTGQVNQATNNYDFVGRVLGGNPGTGGNIPTGSNPVLEFIKMMGGESTVHNCYGTPIRQGCDSYKEPPINLIPVKPITLPIDRKESAQ
jgi:filamentous hemagglutinin